MGEKKFEKRHKKGTNEENLEGKLENDKEGKMSLSEWQCSKKIMKKER